MSKNDGKYLEVAVDKYLRTTKQPEFHWRRLFDSYSVRKGAPPQPSDYLLSWAGKFTAHLECKTTSNTTLRLSMFDQYGDMIRWSSAGVPGFVLVHFYILDRLFVVPVTALEKASSWKANEKGIEIMNPTDLSQVLKVIFGDVPK